jgi:PhnB protein
LKQFQPIGKPTIAVRIFHHDVEGLVAFLEDVFGAEGEYQADRPCEMRIGDSILMVSDGGGVRPAFPACLYVYVPDVDAVFSKALARGARVIDPPAAMPWGDRRATVEDGWGNLWQIATRQAG